MSSIVNSSGTRRPSSRIGATCRPSSDPSATAARNMSPVATWGTPYPSAIRFAWVPLPDPCGPKMRMRTGARLLLQEAFVGAHHHLRLHLPHGVERDSDDDQHRRSAEGSRGRLREPAVADEEAREDSDSCEEERSREREPREHTVEILRRRRAGSNARDVAAVLA